MSSLSLSRNWDRNSRESKLVDIKINFVSLCCSWVVRCGCCSGVTGIFTGHMQPNTSAVLTLMWDVTCSTSKTGSFVFVERQGEIPTTTQRLMHVLFVGVDNDTLCNMYCTVYCKLSAAKFRTKSLTGRASTDGVLTWPINLDKCNSCFW